LFTQIVWHRALLSGGSATELSATDAWAEPLPVMTHGAPKKAGSRVK
jgi:hypothetical protein